MKRFLPLFLSVCLSVVLLISGCGGGKAKRGAPKTGLIQASSSKVPSWITDIPEEKSYYYFVGTSVDSESYDAGKKSALNDALSQVVGMIGLKVSSSSTIEEQYFAEQYTTTISAQLYSEGRAKLQDAEIRETYYELHRRKDGSEFYRVWALLKYSKSEIAKEQERLQSILALKYGEVMRLEEMALSALQRGMLFDAIVFHLNAAAQALSIDDGEVLFDRNMIRAGEFLSQIRFKKTGEDQVGWVGRALEKPLQLQVYSLVGEQEIPVPNVTIRFSYRIPRENRAGYKYQVVNRTTDIRGLAEFSVDQVYEVNDSNRVEARIDLSPYIDQMKSVPDALIDRVKTIEDILATKRAVFTFHSDTLAREIRMAVYFVQQDQDGKLIPKPVTAPAVYEILYEKKFSIRLLDMSPSLLLDKPEDVILQMLSEDAGKGVKRILFGSARVLEYDMLSGFHTARAEANATLYDRESGDVLRIWKITRSATGATKERAGDNALSEVGKSLGEMVSNTMP